MFFICFVHIALCKLTPYYDSEIDYNNNLETEFQSVYERRFRHISDENSKLWKLKIENNLNSTRLLRGTLEEEADFDSILEPMRHVWDFFSFT